MVVLLLYVRGKQFFFHIQTVLNEFNVVLPTLSDNPLLNSHLDSITLSELKVESVLKTFIMGKASGPNGLSNCILRELSSELAISFRSLFNQFLERVICLLSQIIDLYPYLTLKVNCLKDSFSYIYLIHH